MLLRTQVLHRQCWDLVSVSLPLQEFFLLGPRAKGPIALGKRVCFFSSEAFARCFNSGVHSTSRFGGNFVQFVQEIIDLDLLVSSLNCSVADA